MTIRQVLSLGIGRLKKAGVESPVLDAELLLAHSAILQNRRIDRAWLYAYGDKALSEKTVQKYKHLIARRTRREPVAYILGHKEFYGLDFLVDRRVLIPRPESELLVEQAMEASSVERLASRVIVDVGTGSGCIVISMAKALSKRDPRSANRYFATDSPSAALHVARKNARRHGVEKQITFLRGNLLEPIIRNVANSQFRNFVIVANLPYLPTAEWQGAMPEVHKWEPRQALHGGRDGLKYYHELFEQISRSAKRYPLDATIFCELCPHQFPIFQKLVQRYFYQARVRVVKDLSGKKRVAVVRI